MGYANRELIRACEPAELDTVRLQNIEEIAREIADWAGRELIRRDKAVESEFRQLEAEDIARKKTRGDK